MKMRLIRVLCVVIALSFTLYTPSVYAPSAANTLNTVMCTDAASSVSKPKTAKKPKVFSRKQKQFTVTVAEDTLVSGYQIKYSTSSKLNKAKTVNLKRSEGLSKTIEKLKNNTKYYVAVRGYITSKSGKTYGNWSKTASVTVTSKAPHADLPDEMLDSYIMDAMKYVGYKADKQAKTGNLLQDCASGPRTPMNIRSGITYNGVPMGYETIKDKSTVSGKAPDIGKFRSYGLVCASFVTYYYCNYLPNIAGIDTSHILKAVKKSGYKTHAAAAWGYAGKYLVKQGKATVVDKVSKGKSLWAADLEKLQIGDLITFRIPNMGEECGHVAVYAGTNNEGDHFVAHVGSDEGPVFQTLERFENVVNDHDGCAYSIVYRFNDIPTSKYQYQVSLSKTKYKYTGTPVTPKVTVKDAAGKTINKKNYTLHYSSNTKVGTGKVTVVFKNSYKGAQTLKFKIVK